MQITLYTTTTCPYCKMLKDYLTEKQAVYSEKYVDQDDVAREEMIKLSDGYLGVPFSVIMKDDGSVESIIGFDKGKFDALFSK